MVTLINIFYILSYVLFITKIKMSENSKKLNEVFILYSKWKYKEAEKLNNEVLLKEPDNVYSKRYAKLLSEKISNPSDKKAKIKWKSIKCPHCLAKIPFSWLTEEQREEIKKGKYNDLEIKCPYCHTNFVLQKRKANSILWLKIGDTATIEGKKYRLTGYVQYRGYWHEWSYSEWTKYLEWLLLWENNEYKYFSEWASSDDWIWTNEFELSEKYIPKQIWKIDYIKQTAEIEWKSLYAKEWDKVRVISVYWENSKNTEVWEQVEIYDFWDIIIEKESSWWQIEAGFYKTKELSWKQAAKLFWKEYSHFNDISSWFWKVISNSWENGVFTWIFLIFIFWINFISLIPKEVWFWLIWIILLWIIYYFSKDIIPEKYKKIFLVLMLLPIFSFFVFKPIFNSFIENKQKIELKDLKNAKKIEIKFTDYSVMKEKATNSTHYDYGGTRTYYQKNTWLKFSIYSEDDKKILEKIKNYSKAEEISKWSMVSDIADRLMSKKYENFDDALNNTNDEDKINKMFKWLIYKLK